MINKYLNLRNNIKIKKTNQKLKQNLIIIIKRKIQLILEIRIDNYISISNLNLIIFFVNIMIVTS
jgi:hypothetical protein